MVSFIDSYGSTIGVIGGVVGLVSGVVTIRFQYKDYREKHISEFNKKLFERISEISYKDIFGSSPNDKADYDYQGVDYFIENIETFKREGNHFRGWQAKLAFHQLQKAARELAVESEIIKSLRNAPDLRPKNIEADKVRTDKKIARLDTAYKSLAKSIYGYFMPD